jgi:outer membrane protein TolC
MRRSCSASISAVALIVVAGATAATAQQPYRLTLKEAIQLALKANFSVLASATRIQEAAGTRERRLSNLMPKPYLQSSLMLQKINLATLGINIPFINPAVGPFSTYDLRLYVDQPLLDLQAYHAFKSSEQHELAAGQDYQDTRDLVIRSVASLYLNAQAAAALVDSTQSRVTLSQAFLKLANDQHDAGVATGLDVLRAKVQLADDQQALLVAKNTATQALLVLARTIGLNLGVPLELAQPLAFQPVNPPQVPEAMRLALADRADYLSLLRQRDEQRELQLASRARLFPQISVGGNYGGDGRTLPRITGVGALQGTLRFTIFDADRQGERTEIASRVQRLNSQISDMRLQIEEDVREALLNLDSASNEVQVANDGLTLAQQEVDLARVRFQAGAANSIEVTTAQDSLARAQQNQVAALTRYVDAKIALARALGGVEKNYDRFLGQ